MVWFTRPAIAPMSAKPMAAESRVSSDAPNQERALPAPIVIGSAPGAEMSLTSPAPAATRGPAEQPVRRAVNSSNTTLDPVALTVFSTPTVFEAHHFRKNGMPADPLELARATVALVEQANLIPDYLGAHSGIRNQLADLQFTATTLLADTGSDPEKSAAMQKWLAGGIVGLQSKAHDIGRRTARETEESLAVTRQLSALAAVIQQNVPPSWLSIPAPKEKAPAGQTR